MFGMIIHQMKNHTEAPCLKCNSLGSVSSLSENRKTYSAIAPR